MNDRFKFRIAVFERHDSSSDWVFKEYIKDNNNWHLTMCGDIASNNCYPSHYRRDNAPDSVNMVYEAEFCTGLKDKNGKLIYEGDIVEVINCRGANAVVEYNLEGAKFVLKGEKFASSALQHIRKDYFEVIGNIYENEDLLKCENQ